MRTALVVLALAACTQTDEERRADLESQVEIACGGGRYDCFRNADRVVSCMNDALANGDRAWIRDERQDSYGYYVYTDYFTVDGRVLVWELQDGSNFSNEQSARELTACTGPFVAGQSCTVTTGGIGSGAAVGLHGCP